MKIEYVCFTNYSGYATAARFMIKALLKYSDHEIFINPIDSVDGNFRNGETDLKHLVRKCEDPDRIQVLHCIPTMQRRIKPTARTIGCGTFEGQIPPQVWIKFLKKNRAIFCPSVYNTEQFKSQLDQVFLIPHTLDLQFYNAEVKASQNYSKFSFLFLNSWRKRKGIDLLLSAWQKAFKTNKNVQLVIKTDEPLRAEKQIRLYQDAAPIIVDKNKYKYSELPGYIKSFDCVINPTYGEGFGLTGLQALALGVSLITTNHSGCTDYAKNNNSFLLHPKGFEKVPCLDNISQFRNQEWPILDVEELVCLMRAVYWDKILREARISNGLITAGKFSHGLAVQKFNEMIKSLY